MAQESEIVHPLVDHVVTLEYNPHYRISDIVGLMGEQEVNSRLVSCDKGPRWEQSVNAVLSDPRYENSLLKKYLEQVSPDTIDHPLLLQLVIEHMSTAQIKPAEDTELILYIRMGDVVQLFTNISENTTANVRTMDRAQFKRDVLTPVVRYCASNHIQKISVVTCFNYSPWHEPEKPQALADEIYEWSYNQHIQQVNRSMLSEWLYALESSLPDIDLAVYSHTDVDQDFCYCITAKHSIFPDKFNWGNFGKLMHLLSDLHQAS